MSLLPPAIHRNGVFLVGDASIAMPPHIAQAGNQTLEDAAFIKKCLQEKNDFKQFKKSMEFLLEYVVYKKC